MSMTAPLQPADHAFISACSALVLESMMTKADEDLYVDTAERMVERINRQIEPLARVYLSFIQFKAARLIRNERPSALFGMQVALHSFHRWRMGVAVGAAEAKA